MDEPGADEVRDVQNIADVLVDPEGALDRRNHWGKASHSRPSLWSGRTRHRAHPRHARKRSRERQRLCEGPEGWRSGEWLIGKLLNLRELAGFRGVHPNTVCTYAPAGRVRATKAGRDWRFIEANFVGWNRPQDPDPARMQSSADRKEASWHSGSVQAYSREADVGR